MKSRQPSHSTKFPPFAYFALVIYICIFFGSAWFSSYQNRVARQMVEVFKQQENQLLDEIGKREIEEADLTSIERIHEIAREFEMIQSSEPAYVLSNQ
ncbi:MAG: cell division protein FtsL [Candidatus Poribacteria bacterium]|nr:cell division protein FtsL [Candidatus Poribacteria bacterium]